MKTRDRVFQTLVDLEKKGYQPTLREIGSVVQIHHSNVLYHLLMLESEGRVRRDPNQKIRNWYSKGR